MTTQGGQNGQGLLGRASRAMFWNASMLPLIMAINLGAAVMIRRGFGFESGTYDVALGLINTLLAHAGLGVPMTIGQFVPALERTGRATLVRRFVARVSGVRIGLLLLVLVVLNVVAQPAADAFSLGPSGVILVRLVSALAVLRAVSDLAIKTLQALLAHFSANLVQLAQAIALVAAAANALLWSGDIPFLLWTLTALSAAVAVWGAWLAWRTTNRHAAAPGPAPRDGVDSRHPVTPGRLTAESAELPPWPVVGRFSLFMYTFEASNYFATPAFASVALAALAGATGTIAVFNVAFQIPLMIVTVLLAGFQGLYRPLFAGVLAERSPQRLQTTFSEISKVQTALLLPAGVGLLLLMPETIALLFTSEFGAAVPLARALCFLLFAEALFNLGSIILSVDHRYSLTMTTQALRIAAAPVFAWFAMRGDLLTATIAFGAGRVLASVAGFLFARRLYGVRYPWAFTARVAMASTPMAALVAGGRLLLPAGWPTTLALTGAGLVLTLVGARWFRVLGAHEAGLLRRAGVPGGAAVARLLVPESREVRC